MTRPFEELAYCTTEMGELILRRRKHLSQDSDIYEIKLNGEFLMSSLFTEGETELARRGLAGLQGEDLGVVVGGLGLGYTALAALENRAVGSLLVVDRMQEVISWHEQGLVPAGKELSADPRCRFVHADFFALARGAGFDPGAGGRTFDAILLDIDHSPRALLHPAHAWLYEREGLSRLASFLRPGGAFALWSNDPPDEEFADALEDVFAEAQTHTVSFYNPHQNRESANTVYVARRGRERDGGS